MNYGEVAYVEAWNRSYSRGDNHIYYPKEETLRFLSKHVRKRVKLNHFEDILVRADGLRGLDFGCGIGRGVVLLHEFGIDGHGVDISTTAIEQAKDLADAFGVDLTGRLSVLEGPHLPYADGYFDLAISEGVLDSMPFQIARTCLGEIVRCTRQLIFFSVIARRPEADAPEEEIVQTPREHGTVQSYFDESKINQLIEGLPVRIIDLERQDRHFLSHRTYYGRFYVTLERLAE